MDCYTPKEAKKMIVEMYDAARTGKYTSRADFYTMLDYHPLHKNGDFVNVFSGYLIFYWDDAAEPEFYYINLAVTSL